MRRVLSSAAFVVCLVTSTVALGTGALGGAEWCEEDPVFMVNGAIIDVTTSYPAEYRETIKEIEFELLVPSNATAVVVSLPSNVPTTATIIPSLDPYMGIGAVPVVVRVTVKASGSFDTLTRITGTYTSTGDDPLTGDTALGDWEAGISMEPGMSNVATQVSYSLLGL
jgi:hypothetical protein